MNPILIICIVLAYFLMLLFVAQRTSKGADNTAFFTANRQSPWYLVAFGMIGASLSGVTFISVPGWVATSQFSYMQVVLGYLVGYFVIATVLMPLYYKLNLISIYVYLEKRFGKFSYKTGAFFFLLSRLIGASFRMFIVANVLQITVFDALNWNVPFAVTVFISVLLIWLYTFKGGIKTIVWTDTLQTFFMLLSVGISIAVISMKMNISGTEIFTLIKNSEYSKTFFFDNPNEKLYFFKQFFSGAFIAIVMTGLDQDMMQKNLTCKNIGDAQKNMFWFSIVLVFVNLAFLALGVMLYEFSCSINILEINIFSTLPEHIGKPILLKDFFTGEMIYRKTDDIFPILATQNYISPILGIFFILGLIAAAYSSADSALAALTTSFCIDILNVNKFPADKRESYRKIAHIFISLLMIVTILLFKVINNDSVINAIFSIASYTYGPLLGLYAFGLFTKRLPRDKFVPYIAIASPLICYIIDINSVQWLGGYKFGYELLILNGLLTFLGLFLLSLKKKAIIE